MGDASEAVCFVATCLEARLPESFRVETSWGLRSDMVVFSLSVDVSSHFTEPVATFFRAKSPKEAQEALSPKVQGVLMECYVELAKLTADLGAIVGPIGDRKENNGYPDQVGKRTA